VKATCLIIVTEVIIGSTHCWCCSDTVALYDPNRHSDNEIVKINKAKASMQSL